MNIPFKKKYCVLVKGTGHRWGIDTYITEETANDWRADGLEVNGPILNTIPVWVVSAQNETIRRLCLKAWIFFEDLFNFRNPFNKD